MGLVRVNRGMGPATLEKDIDIDNGMVPFSAAALVSVECGGDGKTDPINGSVLDVVDALRVDLGPSSSSIPKRSMLLSRSEIEMDDELAVSVAVAP